MAQTLKTAQHPAAPTHTTLSHYLEARDGTSLFFKDWGTGSPVVFVNSWSMPTEMWDYPMTRVVQAGLRAVAYDHRGCGRSAQPGSGYNFDTLADDLASVLETLDLREATLAGHSMAGGIMARYLARHGAARVSRLLMLAPSTPFLIKTDDNPEGIDRSVFQAMREAMARDRARWLHDNAAPFVTADTSPQQMAWMIQQMLQSSLHACLQLNIANTETDFRPDLRRISLPTLIIHGDADASAPLELTGRRTQALIPGSRLKVYPGAPHGLYFTHQEQFVEDLLEFVQG
jgi:non-heme chloroperoxidase